MNVKTQARFESPYQIFARQIRDSNEYLTPLQEQALTLIEDGCPSQLIQEAAATGDFPAILRDAMHKKAMKAFKYYPTTWRQVTSTVSDIKDFRNNYRDRLSEAEDLQQIEIYGEYQDSDLIDEDLSYRVYKYGRKFSIAWETLVDDDRNRLNNQPKRFGRAAAKGLDKKLWRYLIGNPTLWDGTALFASAHGNIVSASASGTKVLNETNLILGYNLMRTQHDLHGDPVGLVPRILACSPEMEITSWKVTHAGSMPLMPGDVISGSAVKFAQQNTTDLATPNAPNFWKGRLRPLIVPWMGEGYWMMIADPGQNDTMEVGFLNGKETPDILVQDGARGESFTNDKITYRVRFVFGKTVLDYRSFVLGSTYQADRYVHEE